MTSNPQMKTYHPLGKWQCKNTNDVQLKLFSHNPLYWSIVKGNKWSVQQRTTQRLFNGSILILFICNKGKNRERVNRGCFCSILCVWTLKRLALQNSDQCFFVIDLVANVNHMKANCRTIIIFCVCHHKVMGAGLTVKTAVSSIFCHTAAHRLVPLSDVTCSPI